MNEHAIVAGSFADFKIVKTRSVAQLIIEVNIEDAENAIRAFGVPMPGAEIRVAVARLVDQPPEPKSLERSEKAKLTYANLPEGQQAVARSALYAKDFRFHAFSGTSGEADAVKYIRTRCGVTSRKEIAEGGAALDWFLTMESEFKRYVGMEAAP